MTATGKDPSEGLNVPWTDIVRFVRQLSHDIRNNLNAAELQSAYIAELATDEELQTEIQRLREMLTEVGGSLQRLTTGLGQINPHFIPYRAAEFLEDMKQRAAKDFPNDAAKVTWSIQVGDAELNIDPQLLQQAFMELLRNAFQHERDVKTVAATATIENKRLVFRLLESKARFELSVENWGRQPFHQIGQGRYGLGLNKARVIVEAHHGELRADFDRTKSTLISTIALPLANESKA